MQRVKVGLVCLSWLFLASAVSAQSAADPTTGVATVQSASGGGMLNGTYFDVRSVIGDGVGYVNSYQQIGAFTPFWLNEDAFIAPNTRLIVTNSTQTGVNTGLVGRKYFDNLDRIFGVYGYYDNDQDSRNFRYSQFTVGAETLGRWWDMRGNAYVLNGMSSNFMQAQGITSSPFYVGNNIDFRAQQLRDQALGGADGEVGVPLSPYTPWFRGYAGMYGYATGGSGTYGFRGRLEATVSNDLTLSVMVSNDAIYGTNVNGVIDFKFSGFQPTKYFPNLTTRQRLLNPVQRNWRIATRTVEQDLNVAAINPATGNPYFIVHVNNTAPAGGNGTIEHPYNHLVNAPQADIILVHRGDATSAATAVTGSTTLSNNERLLGDGILSTVLLSAQYGSSTIFQTFNLPGTSNTGIYPYVTNPAGNIVTLANNNEVAGLNLVNAAGSAITNTAAGSNSFNLHNLEITGNAGKGIDLVNASGVGIISNINVGTRDHLNPGGLGNNTAGGIQISTGNPAGLPSLYLQLSNVDMNASSPAAQAFGVSLTAPAPSAGGGSLDANFNNVIANGNGTGIQLSESSELLTVNMNTVRANNSAGVGIGIQGTGGAITVDGTNVAAMNSGSDNLEIGSKAAPIVTSTVGVTLNQANFSGSRHGSGIVFSQTGGTGALYLPGPNGTPGSTVSGNAVDGLAIYATNSAYMNANVQNGYFANNGQDAFHVEAGMGSTVNLLVDPTNASNSGRDGLYYNLGQDSVLNTSFLNTNLNNSGQSAVSGTLANFAAVNLYFNNTTGAFSGGDGFYLNASKNSVANVEVDNGTFAGSGRLIGGSSAINIVSDNSTVNLLTDQTLGNNLAANGTLGKQAYGLTLNLQDSSVFTGNILNGSFSNMLVDAYKINDITNSNATLTVLNTDGSHSLFDGLVANVDNSYLGATFTNSNVNNSGRDGMNFSVVNGGEMTANFSNSSFNGSGGSGIIGVVNGTNSIANINLTNLSTVNASGASGLDFSVNGGSLNVAAIDSSFSDSGLKGAIGSGVLGVVNNDGVARLDFINTNVNDNLDNGIFVTTQNGSSIQAAFSIGSIDNNGLAMITPHYNDGILLQMSNSGFSSLNVSNGAQVSNNGNDGIAIVATNSTNFQGTFDSVSILNNGQAVTPIAGTGAGLNVTTETNSTVSLTLNGVTMNNSGIGAATQQVGFLSATNSSSQMTASLTSVDLSGNLVNAINAAVASSSVVNMSLVNVDGDNSGNTGGLFNVTTGGQLEVDDSLNASFSQEGGSGILVQVDGANSVANFGLDTISLTNNGFTFGGQGFSGLATGGGTLNASLVTSQLTNNANQGIQLIAADTNSVINFNIVGSNVDFNNGYGLLINSSSTISGGVIDGAVLNYRSVNTTYNNNGLNGGLDGVNVSVIGNGPSDSATARLLFSGGSMDNNQGNGITLSAQNGATLTTSLDNISASNNLGFGIMASGSGTNTKFNLLMGGTNTFDGNGLGPISTLDFSHMDQVVLDLAGSFDNSTGDGIHIDLQNINNALVAVTGPGTINSSALDGININMLNVTNGSVLINGLTSIDNSGGDGIRVAFDTVANGAIALAGPMQVNSSGGDGVNISVANSTLVDGMSFGTANIDVLTLTSNLATPLNGTLPAPVNFTLDSTGLVPTLALAIDNVTADTSGNTGFNIQATNSTIQTLSVTNSTVATANGTAAGTGDTIHFDLTSTPVTTLNLIGNQVGGAKLNGINFDLNGSPIGTVNIYNNTSGLIAGGSGSAVGDTLPVIVPGFNGNTLAANDDGSTGAVPLGFAADFFGTTYNSLFVNNNGNVTFTGPLAAFTPFSLLTTAIPMIAPFFADVDTRSGNPVTYGVGTVAGLPAFGVNWLGVDHFDAAGGGTNGQPPNSFQLVIIDRSDIAPGDFDFEFNYQSILWEAGQASGSNAQGLGGSSARVGYSNGTNTSLELAGSAVNGALLDSGPAATSLIHNDLNSVNLGRYIFFVRNGNIGGNAPSGDDGIRMNATNGSTIGNFNVVGNTIENAGKNGIEMLQTNTDINNQVYSNNTISNNGGDGIRMVNPTTPSGTIGALFTNNTISANGGTGVNLSLVTGAQNLNASFGSNTITGNTGGPGINIQLADNKNMTGGFDSNTVSTNGAQGINIKMGLNGVITSNFTDNTINGNKAEGINLALDTGGHFEGAQFYGNTIGTSTAPNGSLGVRLTVPDQASYNWNLGSSTQAANLISGNAGAGVGILQTGSGAGNLTVQNTTFSHTTTGSDPNFTGQGLGIILNNTATLNNAVIGDLNAVNSVATNDVTFSNNAGAGLSILGTGNSTMQNLLITNVNSEANTGDGIDITRIGSPIFTNTTIQNSQITGNAKGIDLLATNALMTDTYTIQNNSIQQNTSDGILLDARFDAQIFAEITGNTISNNSGDGIHAVEQQNASTDNRFISGTWTGNTIDNNTLNGIEINARSNINIGANTTEFQNFINGNGGAGILISAVNAPSTTLIQGNQIDSNGTNGITVSANNALNTVTIDTDEINQNTGNGIQMIGQNLTASIDNSTIRFNTNDGVHLESVGGGPVNVTIGANNPNGNDISDNSGHGIYILNDNGGQASYTIDNNGINRNGLQGVYAVNSAGVGAAGDPNSSSFARLANVFDNSQMKFVMNNNSVQDDGHLSNSDTTGLYLLVGTNGASNSFTDPGGFASTASAVNSLSTANFTGRGGVIALVTNNIFGGNAGHDVAFQSFTSTVDPTTTTGTWTDGNAVPIVPVFNVTSYQSDPLARLDLQFTGNTGQDADVTRSGAFYNNAEPVFKSRIDNNLATASPPGPFDDGSRARNAQRLASHAPPFNDPTTPPSTAQTGFLYPGVGNSTFRVTTDSSTAGFATQASTFSTQIGLGGFGSLPFAWSQTLAP